ncbi:hypothetical protein [Bacillus subtilis]|uniref:hypothetical protein n=1 Tax=Bacillus subtilis TaxID=1423 RepID=UPI00100A08B5|nr:hypothetical protein [Bacillus subtilis]QAW54936.1 hypothetical protein ETL60_14560 [Bacillus subtilis]
MGILGNLITFLGFYVFIFVGLAAFSGSLVISPTSFLFTGLSAAFMTFVFNFMPRSGLPRD